MGLIQCPECKKEVSNTAEMCPHCGYNVKAHFYKIEREKQIALARVKRLKVLKVVVPIVIIIIIICTAFGINSYILSQRTTFVSEKAMKNFLVGYWNITYDFDKNHYEVLRFYDDEEISHYNKMGDYKKGNHYDKVKYNYKRGCVTVDNKTYIVTKEGKILKSGTRSEFEKGKPDAEYGFTESNSVAEISDCSFDINGATTKLKYKITNKTECPFYGTITFNLKNDAGDTIETVTDIFFLDKENLKEYEKEIKKETTKNLKKVRKYNAIITEWTLVPLDK